MAKQKNTTLNSVLEMLGKVETDLKRVHLIIQQVVDAGGWDIEVDTSKLADLENAAAKLWSSTVEGDITVVEWVYDGYFMIWSDKKKYPVPMNYSSKTKLIPGDVLKLRIMPDGKLIYKLIWQANKTYVRATLSKSDENKFTAITDDGDIFFLNQAAVTYFKGKTGDELSIIINADGVGDFAAIEALIPQAG